MREHYPRGGVDACLSRLDRHRSAIYQQARRMRLHAPGYSGVRKRYPHDPAIDEQIRALHAGAVGRGDITAMARRIGRPVWWVSKRAREMGLKTPRFRELPWSDEELQILEDNAHVTPETVRKRLAANGYTRSGTAIVVKRKRLGIEVRQARQDAGVYCANQLAELMGLDRKTPVRWHHVEGLPAREVDGTLRIKAKQLRDWITDHPYHIDLRKIPAANYPWFFDLMRGRI